MNLVADLAPRVALEKWHVRVKRERSVTSLRKSSREAAKECSPQRESWLGLPRKKQSPERAEESAHAIPKNHSDHSS